MTLLRTEHKQNGKKSKINDYIHFLAGEHRLRTGEKAEGIPREEYSGWNNLEFFQTTEVKHLNCTFYVMPELLLTVIKY